MYKQILLTITICLLAVKNGSTMPMTEEILENINKSVVEENLTTTETSIFETTTITTEYPEMETTTEITTELNNSTEIVNKEIEKRSVIIMVFNIDDNTTISPEMENSTESNEIVAEKTTKESDDYEYNYWKK
ncbi:uncharacterized protein LOC127289740 [Leptopilina boulardi]|uniref:uncharacterized protein LOC127289740 n=1 Tax=Leptopilina boulardi TaxID=63433 RepID=UPI0021F55C8B|nr:uncharacterized protein LOC127289740 [Leptopilina boulardi]